MMEEENKTKMIVVRIHEDLLEKIDELRRKKGYNNRSEFIRAILIRYLEEEG